MKIAIVTDTYPPMTNGVSVFCRSLATELAKCGDEVIVLAPSVAGKPYREAGEIPNLTICRLRSFSFPFYPDQVAQVESKRFFYRNGLPISPTAYHGLHRELSEFQPDVIHSHMPGPIGWSALAYAKRNRVPFVTTGHSYPDNFTANMNIPKLVKRQMDAIIRRYLASIMRRSDLAVFPAHTALDDLFTPRAKRSVSTLIVRNGVDLSQFSPAKPPANFYQKHHIPRDKPIIAFIGRLDKEKSVDSLIHTFHQLRSDHPDLHLLLVGDGNFRQSLVKLIAKLDLDDHTTFTGRMSGTDLVNMHRAATLYATASTTEVQSIAILEAMACGKPIIALDAGPMYELCRHEQNGLLAPQSDLIQFAAKISRVITDSRLRSRLSRGSLAIAAEYDISHSANQYRNAYLTLRHTSLCDKM